MCASTSCSVGGRSDVPDLFAACNLIQLQQASFGTRVWYPTTHNKNGHTAK
jgi:hypothetical protein